MEDKEKIIAPTVLIKSFKGRDLPHQYLNFVRDYWVKTYKKYNRFMSLVDPASYYRAYPKYINTILARPEATIRLAMLSDDEDVLLGFSVSEGPVLHFVNVPRDYRGQGIGRKLVPFVVERFTHVTETGLKLWANKAPKAIFDPFY